MNRLVGLSFVTILAAACADDSLHGLGQDEGEKETQDACVTSLDCDAGDACEAGTCVPDCDVQGCDPTDPPIDPPIDPPVDPVDPPLEFPLYFGGQWDTEYHLDWSDYMGPLGNLGSPLDFIDQILMDNIDIPIINDIIDNYVPDWVGDLVHILNGLVHFFQDVKIEGVMSLSHVQGSPNDIDGSEVWNWGYVQVIDNCPLGEMDPNYPSCAELAVPLNLYMANFGTIGTTAQNFSATIVGGNQLRIVQRQVEMEIGQFLMFVINMAINLATNGQYPTLNDALLALINCPGLQASIEGFLGQNPGSMGYVGVICVDAVDAAIVEITNGLNAVTVDWDVMEFDQNATAFDDDGDESADRLGAPPATPGLIENGDFQALIGADMNGTWFGTRP